MMLKLFSTAAQKKGANTAIAVNSLINSTKRSKKHIYKHDYLVFRSSQPLNT